MNLRPRAAFPFGVQFATEARRTRPDTKLGSITAFYSVLVEGDDENEPIADTVRGLLDGHVWLSRRLAERGHFPAIDVLQSISRLMNDITQSDYRAAAQLLRRMLAVLHSEDLLSIGAYRKGTNRELDVAVAMKNEIHAWLLRQAIDQRNVARNSYKSTKAGSAMRWCRLRVCHRFHKVLNQLID